MGIGRMKYTVQIRPEESGTSILVNGVKVGKRIKNANDSIAIGEWLELAVYDIVGLSSPGRADTVTRADVEQIVEERIDSLIRSHRFGR
jgi:hypothetical protein